MPAPANDDFSNRILITLASSPVSGDNTDATLEAGEFDYTPYNGTGDNSVWYEFVAPTTGKVEFDTEGSIGLTDSLIFVFTGSDVTNLTLVQYDDDSGTGALSRNRVSVVAGTSYKICVIGYNSSHEGSFILNFAYYNPPSNDEFDNAQLISGISDTESFNTDSASIVLNEATLVGIQSASATLWYKWVCPQSGMYTLDTVGSSFNCAIRVFTGSSINSLTIPQLYASDGSLQPRVFWANIGDEFKIVVGGTSGSSGNGVLNLTSVLPSIDVNRYKVNSSNDGVKYGSRLIVDSLNNYYIITPYGIHKSVDFGLAWENFSSSIDGQQDYTSGLVIDSNDNMYLFFSRDLGGAIYDYSYAKYTKASESWGSILLLSSLTHTVFTDSKFISIDASDNVHFCYVIETTGDITDLYYRKLTNDVLGVETNLTNYSVNPLETKKSSVSHLLVNKDNDIYIFYSHSHTVGNPNPFQNIAVRYIKNFNSPVDIIPEQQRDVGGAVKSAIADENGIVYIIYQDVNGDMYFATGDTFIGTILDSTLNNYYAITTGSSEICFLRNSVGEMYIFFTIRTASIHSDIYYIKNSGSGWGLATLLYRVNNKLKATSMTSNSIIPVVNGLSSNYVYGGFSFFERGGEGLYYVEMVAEAGDADLCPYVEGGQARKMVTAVTGLDHLNGAVVQAQMDGIVPETNSFTVSGGSITLPEKAAVAHVGLPYNGTIRMLKASEGSIFGTGQTKKRRIFLSVLELYRTLGLKIGLDEDHLDPIFDSVPALPLFIGEHDKLPNTSWDEEAELIIRQDKPLPAHILALVNRSEVEEGI